MCWRAAGLEVMSLFLTAMTLCLISKSGYSLNLIFVHIYSSFPDSVYSYLRLVGIAFLDWFLTLNKCWNWGSFVPAVQRSVSQIAHERSPCFFLYPPTVSPTVNLKWKSLDSQLFRRQFYSQRSLWRKQSQACRLIDRSFWRLLIMILFFFWNQWSSSYLKPSHRFSSDWPGTCDEGRRGIDMIMTQIPVSFVSCGHVASRETLVRGGCFALSPSQYSCPI